MAFRPIPHQPPIDDDARERTTRGALTLVPPGSSGAAEAFAAASARMLAPMFGRDALVAEVESLLQGETARIVTLTGPGGVGKTRLAVALAERLRPAFPDGVAFIPLASVRDPHHVIPAIAAALGLSESPTRTIGDEMHRWLRGKGVLLVLDNLEQVLACGPALAALLADSPGLTILATSRAPLAISGEQRVVVPPLAVPAPGEVEPAAIRTHPAVQLFEDRARRTDPQFAITPRNADAVAAICSRLDGLPLALELAAARTAILSPAALLARLSDRFRVLAAGTRGVPERHRTLRQAIAWTYDLLPDNAQWIVRMLSVFEDGWSLELVEALERSASWACGPSPAVSAIDLLHELVDQSLVQVRMRPEDGEPRFRMLETVRAFGQEQAFVLGEDDALRAAHLEAVLAVARSHALDLDSPDRDAVFRRLDPEWENIRAAHAWA
ncbi:MAG: ATP-binding protein, partial [Thermomicrobiales bacterium]